MKTCGLLATLLLLLSLCSCHFGGQGDDSKVNIIRFDKTQYEYIEFNSFDATQRMKSDYYPMTKLLVENILDIGSIADDGIQVKFREYYSDSLLMQLMDDVESKFEDISTIEADLGKAFKSLGEELPDVAIPQVYAQLSALNESIIVSDTLLGISLDKYMGADYPLYKFFYYSYQRKSMSPDRIDNDCLVSLIGSDYPYDLEQTPNLCNLMVHLGRLHYVTAKVLGVDLQEQLDYTDNEWQWCVDNERDIFRFIIENNQLYSTDFMVLRKYLKPSPYVQYFGKQSPSRLGVWIGARIVEAYVKRNNIPLRDLMDMGNYGAIFANSHYLNAIV